MFSPWVSGPSTMRSLSEEYSWYSVVEFGSMRQVWGALFCLDIIKGQHALSSTSLDTHELRGF